MEVDNRPIRRAVRRAPTRRGSRPPLRQHALGRARLLRQPRRPFGAAGLPFRGLAIRHRRFLKARIHIQSQRQ